MLLGGIVLKGRDFIEPGDFSFEETQEVFKCAEEIINNPKLYARCLDGKVLATLFFEPSTRTRLSFEAAMLRLGGKVIGFSDPNSSSLAKGESLSDTIRMVSCYADVAVIRHNKEGAAMVAALTSDMPIINAGDGGHYHPTQTLTDIFTILHHKEKISGLKIGICGDLKFGRTVHSLLKALSRYEGNEIYLISPNELRVPSYVISDALIAKQIKYHEISDLGDIIDKLDILYMTRVQRERFFNEEDYVKLKDCYILTKDMLKNAKKDLMVLHPFPRMNEIPYEIDADPRAFYFEQVKNGMYVRMALLYKILGGSNV